MAAATEATSLDSAARLVLLRGPMEGRRLRVVLLPPSEARRESWARSMPETRASNCVEARGLVGGDCTGLDVLELREFLFQ